MRAIHEAQRKDIAVYLYTERVDFCMAIEWNLNPPLSLVLLPL